MTRNSPRSAFAMIFRTIRQHFALVGQSHCNILLLNILNRFHGFTRRHMEARVWQAFTSLTAPATERLTFFECLGQSGRVRRNPAIAIATAALLKECGATFIS
jgi:hypothetical protein